MKGPELLNMYVGQSEENVRAGEPVKFICFNLMFEYSEI